jgi:hypothetical protein
MQRSQCSIQHLNTRDSYIKLQLFDSSQKWGTLVLCKLELRCWCYATIKVLPSDNRTRRENDGTAKVKE